MTATNPRKVAGEKKLPNLDPSGEATPRPVWRRPGVLVVDDEEAVLKLVAAVLQLNNFEVYEAQSGPQAAALLQKHAKDISLALLDVIMPDVDGPQTLALLTQIKPALKCSFMSGHSGKYSDAQLLALGAQHVFRKPFALTDVVRVLKEQSGLQLKPGGPSPRPS